MCVCRYGETSLSLLHEVTLQALTKARYEGRPLSEALAILCGSPAGAHARAHSQIKPDYKTKLKAFGVYSSDMLQKDVSFAVSIYRTPEIRAGPRFN